MINGLALLVAWQAPSAAPITEPQTAGALLTKMFARYAAAKTLKAHIKMTQVALSKVVSFESVLAYERPDKIYFLQRKSGDSDYSPQLVSDGTWFVYTHRDVLRGKSINFLREPVHPKQGDLPITEMWPMLSTTMDKGDDGFVLETMISRLTSLRSLRTELVSFQNKGQIQINGKTVNHIEGRFKTAGFGEEGDYSLDLTDDGQIVRHQTKFNYGVNPGYLRRMKMPMDSFPNGIEVVTTWQVESAVDVPVSAETFILPKLTSP